MEQDINSLVPSLRDEAAKWRNSPLAVDDLVNGFVADRAESVLNKFDPGVGRPLWSFIRQGFWLYVLSAIAKERGVSRRAMPESQISNGQLGSFQFEPSDGRHDSDPQARVLAQEQYEVVNQALESLSDKNQQLVVMRYYVHLSFADIAEVLDFPSEEAAYKALRRALEKLKPQLQQYWNSSRS